MNITKENGKPKTGLIILIIALVLILIGTGVFVYLFLKTDMFKSNEELFWKYMSQNTQMVNTFKYQTDDRYENKSYSENMKIEFDMQDINLKQLNDLAISVDTQNDTNTNKMHSEISAEYKNEKLLNVEFLKDNDIYALKNTEVANGYIGVENKELKALAQNLDIDTEEIPDEISDIKYSELLNISNEEKQHIIDTYYSVVKNNINKRKYNKRENITISIEGNKYTANEYAITLTQKEYQTLLINALETLKTDSITLNLITTKMKNINKDSKYTNINQLTEEISILIEQLKQKEVSDNEYITFAVYESNGKMISTSIKVINETNILISYLSNENKLIISKENLNGSDENDWNEITITNQNSEEEQYFLYDMKFTNSNSITIEIKKEKTDSGYGIKASLNIFNNVIRIGGERILSQGETVPNITDSTNIILNELDIEKLNILKTRLQSQIMKIIEEKQQIISPSPVETTETMLEIL